MIRRIWHGGSRRANKIVLALRCFYLEVELNQFLHKQNGQLLWTLFSYKSKVWQLQQTLCQLFDLKVTAGQSFHFTKTASLWGSSHWPLWWFLVITFPWLCSVAYNYSCSIRPTRHAKYPGGPTSETPPSSVLRNVLLSLMGLFPDHTGGFSTKSLFPPCQVTHKRVSKWLESTVSRLSYSTPFVSAQQNWTRSRNPICWVFEGCCSP